LPAASLIHHHPDRRLTSRRKTKHDIQQKCHFVQVSIFCQKNHSEESTAYGLGLTISSSRIPSIDTGNIRFWYQILHLFLC
jgi:hypothetical protein